MDEILVWVVTTSTLVQLYVWYFSPKPLTQTHYDINNLSLEDIEEIIKAPTEELRREIVDQRLKLQDYHFRQKMKKDKDEKRNKK